MIDSKKIDELFDIIDKMPWKTDIPNNQIVDICKNVYSFLTSKVTKTKKMIHLFGQSGSGKTTQLLPSALELFKHRNIYPLHICVRNFASLHPEYEKLMASFGKSEIREKTNGFALRCCSLVMAMAIFDGLDIVCEVTLLSKEYEDYYAKLLLSQNYKTLFLGVAVNPQISNTLIERRQKAAGKESNRIVYKTSSDFFSENLSSSLEFLVQKYANFDVVIWNISQKSPIFDGKMKNCFSIFNKERKKTPTLSVDVSSLLKSKIDYLITSAYLLEE